MNYVILLKNRQKQHIAKIEEYLNCGKILQEYATKDKRIKIITQKNSGYGKAINAGLSVATGEYLKHCFCGVIVGKILFKM